MRFQSFAPVTLFLLFFAVCSYAQDSYQYKDHSMQIEGTSTIHDWVSEVTELQGSAQLTMVAGQLTGLQSLDLKIPVKSIVSPKGSIMDNKTYDALEYKDHPNILFKLMQVESITPSGNAYTLKTKGYLTIAGSKRLVNMTVTASVQKDGSVTFSGSKDLKMTDFDISPPTAMLGTMKTGDDIKIVFKLNLDLVQG